MNKLVEDYLNKKAKEAAESEQKKKDALLLKLGLYEIEYSPDNRYSTEYPESELDYGKGTTRYYKKVPVPISDEEYSELLKYQKETDVENNPYTEVDENSYTVSIHVEEQNNTVSIVFKVMAWLIFIGGFIAGIVFGQTEVSKYYSGIGYYSSHTEFSFAAALPYWAICFVSGMIHLGFAEIIQLLDDIKQSLHGIKIKKKQI